MRAIFNICKGLRVSLVALNEMQVSYSGISDHAKRARYIMRILTLTLTVIALASLGGVVFADRAPKERAVKAGDG